jgi:hypothetical protein
MYKASRPNGTDFYTGKIDYAAALKSKKSLKHPRPGSVGSPDAAGYISVATLTTDCTSFQWPARLFEVEIVGESWTPSSSMPNKRAGHELKVVRELPAWQLFGPRGESIVAIIDAGASSYQERVRRSRLRPVNWSSAYNNLWSVVNDGRAYRASLRAALGALCVRLGGFSDGRTAYGAALAVLLRDLLDPTDFTTLVAPYADVLTPEVVPE